MTAIRLLTPLAALKLRSKGSDSTLTQTSGNLHTELAPCAHAQFGVSRTGVALIVSS